MVDGDMQNRLVERYRALSSRHLLAPQLSELSTDSVLLTTETIQSHMRIAAAMRTTVWRDDVAVAADYRLVREDLRIGHDIAVDMTAGQTVTLEKIATAFSRPRTTT
jgi:trehalose/maltose hydrolase-like predicted phosphorylase